MDIKKMKCPGCGKDGALQRMGRSPNWHCDWCGGLSNIMHIIVANLPNESKKKARVIQIIESGFLIDLPPAINFARSLDLAP